jgi:hypothetical protein
LEFASEQIDGHYLRRLHAANDSLTTSTDVQDVARRCELLYDQFLTLEPVELRGFVGGRKTEGAQEEQK